MNDAEEIRSVAGRASVNTTGATGEMRDATEAFVEKTKSEFPS